ncbi:RagB/SusD family nutrient uptake outer membrane protein [Rhodohalobacter sulfatireducens]|uniref:RagB/SusD family nutrient uptake outer membrane protein n=1 Tax=Rhodohalobacter sulfatireducens TaxID=2911366 RepID=A0ABS9KAC2_9BACT|nr:RagB/SusD family nutrient uptake outer membrane protein [Rhodohalobacter sulfatireducens]MCG2587799.1 RagB/SusD family nutrient uptake outer membrane protein [Rhodohalobacter sulfatireducens]
MNTLKTKLLIGIVLFLGFILLNSCDDDNLLNETPKSSVSSETTLTNKAGFEAYLIGLVRNAREELTNGDDNYFIANFAGTDLGEDAATERSSARNYSNLTPQSFPNGNITTYWNWAYGQMIVQANTIIQSAQNPELDDIWENEEEKNRVIAEARFFRGYTYNLLANYWGGVPIVQEVRAEPKFDYVRASRDEVYEFAKNDLEFAAEWLPEVVESGQDGRATSAMANHLLAEVYISLGQYNEAIESASTVINSPNYRLMTERFGSSAGEPGDVYSDLHKSGNHRRSSGNLESLYIWQFEHFVQGGGGNRNGNAYIRNLGPFLTKISAPDGFGNIPTAELGRGVGHTTTTNYSRYHIWNDDNDIRNSEYNFRRTFYYNNPQSSHFGEEIKKENLTREDTLRHLYEYPRKIEGPPWEDNTSSGRINKDVYVYRLAETYLLRAEAYHRLGDNQSAADDINAVRARANASPIGAGEVTIDFILDERARELMFEASRKRTLMRMGKLVERVREWALLEEPRETIQDYHNLWPIPQEAIDANFGSELEQNPGY